MPVFRSTDTRRLQRSQTSSLATQNAFARTERTWGNPPARVETLTPVKADPADIESRTLRFLDLTKLPANVTSHAPALAATYFIVLRMFPDLETLLTCPSTHLPHSIRVVPKGTFIFHCNQCNVRNAQTLLSPEQQAIFDGHITVWRRQFRRKALTRRSFKQFCDSVDEMGRSIAQMERERDAEAAQEKEQLREAQQAERVEQILLEEAKRLRL
ncbi:hypothetical protein K435DRAFT_809763 [Dendrothele bispora CBS 962.96]|uniref:Uncharacterized protein n=1 Tax=Dendrothele bispora (strain CBS 962.96) TaxID=1314807 RepID=A0A4V4HBT0_DENBC|nr:hypothetical protein K435DRAFT_809763 [Dendrothele bispora CBS 962.96]